MTAAQHLNGFDYVVLGILALSCLLAFFRGLVREVLSLIAWIGAGIITIHYYAPVAARLQASFKNPVVADILAIVGIYLLALMGFAFINMTIVRTVKHGEGGGTLDNLLGLGFGALRGALILSLGFFLLSIAVPPNEYPGWLSHAVTLPYLEKGSTLLAEAAPDALHDLATLQKKALLKAQATPPAATGALPPGSTTTEGPPLDNLGYGNSSTQQLNRLMDNTGEQ